MKLEVGKYYKSRDGRKWKCVHIFNDRQYNHVLLIDENKCEKTIYTNLDGTIFNNYTHSENDLISEWVEPIEHELDVCFYRDINGEVYCDVVKFDEDSIGSLAKVKVKFKEGEGL